MLKRSKSSDLVSRKKQRYDESGLPNDILKIIGLYLLFTEIPDEFQDFYLKHIPEIIPEPASYEQFKRKFRPTNYHSTIGWACYIGSLKLVKYFVSRKEPLKPSLVTISTTENRLDIVKCLNKNGIKNSRVMVHAVNTGNLELVKFLGSETKCAKFYKAIVKSCELGKLEILKYLLETNGFFRQKKPDAQFFVKVAVENKHDHIIEYLCQNGTRIMDKLLSSLLKFFREERKMILKLLQYRIPMKPDCVELVSKPMKPDIVELVLKHEFDKEIQEENQKAFINLVRNTAEIYKESKALKYLPNYTFLLTWLYNHGDYSLPCKIASCFNTLGDIPNQIKWLNAGSRNECEKCRDRLDKILESNAL